MELLGWAVIALLQVTALPGWLTVRALHLDGEGLLQTSLLCFGISLTLNHFLVVGLVLAGAYTRSALLLVLLAECALGALLWSRGRRAVRVGPGPQLLPALAGDDGRWLWPFLAAVAAVGFLAAYVPVSFGKPFEFWDAIVSWNRWAVDWEAGRLPARTYHYPQLLPTTWSLLYVMEGRPLQYLARGVMALFPVAIALAFVDLGLRRRRVELLMAASVATVLIGLSLGRYIGSGMADIPVAAFGLLAFYPLFTREFTGRPRDDAGRLVAASLLAVGCALTKQSGLYVAALLPIFSAAALRRWPSRARWAGVGGLALVIAVGVAPWYSWVELQMMRGLEFDELPLLTQDVFGDSTLLQRGAGALQLWTAKLTPPGLLAAVALVMASLCHAPTRGITLCLSLPFTLIWAFYFSYDLRNHALALPFLAWSISGGVVASSSLLRDRPTRSLLALLGLLALLWTGLWVRPSDIVDGHRRDLIEIGSPALNKMLLEYQREHGFDGKILTNYRHLTSFEELRDHYFVNRGAPVDEFWPFRRGFEGFMRIAEDPENGIRFVLLSGRIDPDIKAYAQLKVRSLEWEPVIQMPAGSLYQIRGKGSRRK